MKKLLLPLFGGVLLTSSIGLTTGENVNTAIKLQEKQEMKEQEIFNSWYSINSQSALTEAKIKEIQETSQSWNNEVIDSVINQALQYRDDQVIINWSKLDVAKLPSQILENINLSLDNLNNAINLGYIKVNTTNNNMIQLVYSDNNVINVNSDIIYFDSKIATVNSSYMWFSSYGPSKWWRFWEWGGFCHFNETAVQNEKRVNFFASLANIVFLIKNIKNLSNLVDELSSAWNSGNTSKVNDLLKEISIILGGFDLNLLGNVIEVISVLTAVAAFLLTLMSAGGWIAPFIEMVVGIIASVTGRMVSADLGNGVKWRWVCFVVPTEILAE